MTQQEPLKLSEAIVKYVSAKRAIRMSENTLNGYGVDFRRLVKYLEGDPLVSEIDADTIRGLLLSMDEASNKTLLNTHVALSSLWSWLVTEGLVEEHILRKIRRPRYTPKKTLPFSQAEVKALLAHSILCRQKERNRAIVMFLLDTGVRASELCDLKIADLQKDFCYVRKGKGGKQRIVPISEKTTQAIRTHLRLRRHTGPDEAIFSSERLDSHDGHLTRHGLRNMIYKLADSAGVRNAYPHRFRHTFAIEFLRNDGNIYALQEILGHTTLDMVKRYLAFSQADVMNTHKKASPVDSMLAPDEPENEE